jgi:hypothetical protein
MLWVSRDEECVSSNLTGSTLCVRLFTVLLYMTNKAQNKADIPPGCHAKYDKSCIHHNEDSSFNIEVLRGALCPDAQDMDAKNKQTT